MGFKYRGVLPYGANHEQRKWLHDATTRPLGSKAACMELARLQPWRNSGNGYVPFKISLDDTLHGKAVFTPVAAYVHTSRHPVDCIGRLVAAFLATFGRDEVWGMVFYDTSPTGKDSGLLLVKQGHVKTVTFDQLLEEKLDAFKRA